MHKESSSIAAIELNATPYWEVHLKQNAILTLEDVTRIYQYIHGKADTTPILMDWNLIQGIEFEALEYIARIQTPHHPLAITADSGSIGERYVNLINQLNEKVFVCVMFSTAEDAHNWILSLEPREA